MKLLIATGVYPPESGGPATYTKLLEERLPAMGIEVAVLPFRVVRHLPPGIRHVAYFFKCFQMAKQADAVFAQDTVSVGFPACIAARFAKKKFLVRIPGDYAWEQGVQRAGITDTIDVFQTKHYSFFIEVLRRVQKYVVQRAHTVIVPSEYLGSIARGWGVHTPVRIYNGVELPLVPTVPEARPEGFVVVSVGRLVPWKGMEGIIRAVSREKKWTLVLVGDGPERTRLEDVVRQTGAHVRFTGMLPRTEVLGWMKSADVFVINSEYEGLSHQLLEAMALGARIIATNIGGNPELIRDKEEGLLTPPHDEVALHTALLRISNDAQLAWARGSAAAKRVEEFSIDKTLEQLSALLKKI